MGPRPAADVHHPAEHAPTRRIVSRPSLAAVAAAEAAWRGAARHGGGRRSRRVSRLPWFVGPLVADALSAGAQPLEPLGGRDTDSLRPRQPRPLYNLRSRTGERRLREIPRRSPSSAQVHRRDAAVRGQRASQVLDAGQADELGGRERAPLVAPSRPVAARLPGRAVHMDAAHQFQSGRPLSGLHVRARAPCGLALRVARRCASLLALR
mmetsp:Transcript_92420/g.266821  ORF Transcript_92420/g.266821 Transcript_92420/m.266821 type:complete len:209 (-) Transcript_92420:489-1115(-)